MSTKKTMLMERRGKRARSATAKRPVGRPRNPVPFDTDIFEKFARDLQDGRIPLKQVTFTDDDAPGLRAIIRNTGAISYHVAYTVEDSRPLLKIGTHPDMSLKDARDVARTINYLADALGIDVQEGLHDRLIRELKRDGKKWRP